MAALQHYVAAWTTIDALARVEFHDLYMKMLKQDHPQVILAVIRAVVRSEDQEAVSTSC